MKITSQSGYNMFNSENVTNPNVIEALTNYMKQQHINPISISEPMTTIDGNFNVLRETYATPAGIITITNYRDHQTEQLLKVEITTPRKDDIAQLISIYQDTMNQVAPSATANA